MNTGTALPVWKSDATLADGLDTAVRMGDWSIRPPREYRLVQSARPGKEIEYIWHGTVRKDGTHPFLVVGVSVLPAAAAAAYTPQMIFEPFLNALRGQRTNWGATPVVVGLVDDIPFARARWAGVDPASEKRVHGFLYVGNYPVGDSAKIVVISSQDTEPHQDETLRITGASALTFHRVGGAK